MKIKGLLIDVESNIGKVKEVEIEEGDLEAYYKLLNCRAFDIVTRKIGDKVFDIVCDDEGLFKENIYPSAIAKNGEYMLVGNLFICNHYREHLTSLSKEDVDYIIKRIVIVSVAKANKLKELHTYPVVSQVSYV